MATKKGFIDLISLVLAGGLCSSLAAGIDTIRPGDQLNASDHLVSAKGIFTLGFFGLQDSNNSYLGIWYTEDYTIRVWVANRDKPIFNNSGVLAIDTTGKLMIKTEGGDLIPLNSDQGTTTGNVNATLKDSGNFVVADEKRVLWQSFDYPTDTLLPGMKLGVDLKTGRNWTLTSSLSSDVLASGAFTLSWEPTQDSGQLVIRRRGMLYWTSGVLIDQSFKFMPELDLTGADVYRVKLRYESNEHEKYLTISPMKEFTDVRYPHRSRWILDPDAKILDGSFFILNNFTNFCYGYESDSYSGCATARLPSCRRPNDKFDERSGSFNGLAAPTIDDNPSLSLSDCWAKCWNDCSCRGFDNLVNSNGTGCQLYIGNFTFEQDYTGDSRVTHYVLVPGSSAKGKNKHIWIIIATAISLILMLLVLLCCLRKRELKQKGEKKRQEALLHELTTSDKLNINANEIENDENEGRDLKIFSFASIMAATNNFSSENKLGQGGFGPVYKGELPEGQKIAVKRLSSTSRQGLVEFKNELILITKLQHTNLVRVLGCCIHGEEMMLIYEYMCNKSLDYYLFDPTKREQLDWKMRFNIIEGVAQGLLYLHKYSRLRIIHRDLKASNILLDDNMKPKISDFGMARIFGQSETEANTSTPVGTYKKVLEMIGFSGYMSPEYAMEGTFSMKSDVFSFGVLLLEIVSGKKNTSFYHLDRPINLIGYAWELWKDGTASELLDPTLSDSCPTHQILRTIHLGLLCVQESATDRPTMLDVISTLSDEAMPVSIPKRPAFFTGRSMVGVNTLEGKSKECSNNGVSISTMEAR